MITNVKAQVARLLPKNSFARGVSVLVGGTAGAQLLTVLAAPLLTRLYAPEDFGLVAVYSGLLALIGVIASLRYELAIPLPADDQEAAHVVVLSLLIVLGMTALSALIFLFFGGPIATALGVPRLAGYFWLLPVGVLLAGAYTVFNYWTIRTKRFSTIADTKLRQASATLTIQLLGFKAGAVALLLAQVAGRSVGGATLGKHALARPEFKKITSSGILKAAQRYRRFPIFTTWAGFINAAGHQLPPLMFAALFSAGAAGLYALAHRVLALPATIIGSAIGNVFLSHAAEARREGRLGPLFAKVQDKLAQIGMPPALVLIVAGPELFALFFGMEWRQAGEFAQWLALPLFAGFVASPLSMIFSISDKQDVGLLLQFVLFATRLGMILLGTFLGDLTITVALFSVGSFVCYIIYVIVAARYSGVNVAVVVKSFAKSFGFSVTSIIPIIYFSDTADNCESFCVGLFLAATIITGQYIILARAR